MQDLTVWKSCDFPSPESSSKSSFAASLSENSGSSRKMFRSKSMSNIHPNSHTSGEIRRIRERLLRTNSHVETNAFKMFTKKQKLTLASLALVDFMSFCSMSVMAPFFPKEAAEKGLTETLSGFIFSFYALIMFLTSPIIGKMLPRYGAKLLFLSGMFLAGICNILFGVLEFIDDYTTFVTLCIVLRGFEALGASAFSTASYVFVVNNFPQNIGSVLGILETFVGLGMSTGPALGGLLYSVGGFDLPFFVLGIAMIVTVPLNYYLLPSNNDYNITNKSTSIFKLIKIPAVITTSLVVVVISSTWAFLDPTLEPHLRQFDLTPEKIGLIFLLFSALYGISSPLWGWLADKLNNHWTMMVAGLFLSTIGLLLLGPCPYLQLPNYLWIDLGALCILGVSVALALLPTFQGVLASAIDAGCSDSLVTYSLVAGVWSCMYSLGEVIGPSLGGFLLQYYGFPVTSTIMAMMTFTIGIFTCFFFLLKGFLRDFDKESDSGISETWRSPQDSDTSPLLDSTKEYRMYTDCQYYNTDRKQEMNLDELVNNGASEIKGMIAFTAKGSCEV